MSKQYIAKGYTRKGAKESQVPKQVCHLMLPETMQMKT